MSKTLVTILNHNLPDDTDKLFESLNSFRDDSHDIFVIDNGCSDEGKSKHVTHTLNENIYFGGAINVMFQYIIDNKEYDSLLFLNNDLILHPYNFVNSLRETMINDEYTIVSPTIFQPTWDQGFWFTMHNWNRRTVRPVKWVDFNAPLIHRRLIEEIKQFDSELIYGWGIDMLCGMKCEEMGWKVGVCDWVPVLHLVAKTTKDGKSDITFDEYCNIANERMNNYFIKNNLVDKQREFMKFSQEYKDFK